MRPEGHTNLSRIDEAILSANGERWKKVVRIIVEVAEACSDLPDGDPGFNLISEHIEALVRAGQLEAQGNTRNWRFSEIRITHSNNGNQQSKKAVNMTRNA